jgi:mono/diheme cytochrome c family protein
LFNTIFGGHIKISTKLRTIATTTIGVILISLSANALAADKLDIGKSEYDAACAVCHGLTGKGDGGPLKSLFARPVPNLTVLAKNNKGVFQLTGYIRL